VQDVARVRSGTTGQECEYVSNRNVRGDSDNDQDRLCSSSAAPARHAGRRAGAIIASLLVAGTRLLRDKAGEPGGTQGEDPHDDCERKPSHHAIVAQT
jgi:hypothetical protein